MELLLDTHAFVWWTLDDSRLSASGRSAIIGASRVAVSVVTAWEIAIKVGRGKWPEAFSTLQDFEAVVLRAEFEIVPIAVEHARTAGLLASGHRDPFDRLLAAQASIEGLTLVSADARMARLGAAVLW